MISYPKSANPVPMVEEPAMNSSAIEALLRGLKLENNQTVIAELKTLFNFDYKKDAKVKISQINAIGKFLAKRYFPHLSLEQASFELGYRGMQTFNETVIGKISLAGLNVVSPGYALKLLPKIMSSNVNFGSRRIEKITKTHWEFIFENDPGIPESTAGMVQALLEMIKLQNPTVEITILNKASYKLTLRFSE